MVRILPLCPLEKGRFAFVDDEDYEKVASFKWYPASAGHAIAKKQKNNRVAHFSMHRIIMDAAPEDVVDHIDGNATNNTRANLRITDHKGNAANQRKQATWRGRPTTSKYKGVIKVETKKGKVAWCASIRRQGRGRNLGWFADETHAALAYDRAARELFGQYARLNFPGVSDYSHLPKPGLKGSSGYWGVSWDRKQKKWQAYLRDDSGRMVYIGRFTNKEDAARARDRAALEYNGRAARRLNFPEVCELGI